MKEELRKIYKTKRKNICNKQIKDKKICDIILNTEIYKKANQILIYYSKEEEINTIDIINRALKENKKVALPRCTNKKGEMQFYYINNLTDLIIGKYNIMEPKSYCKIIKENINSICLVPGYTFNKLGYRIGYGNAYYDNFLRNYRGQSIGLCYSDFLTLKNFNESHDIAVNYICSEEQCFKT